MKIVLIVISMVISLSAISGQTCTRNGNIIICEDEQGHRTTCSDNGPVRNCW